jgi:hypothetical protein
MKKTIIITIVMSLILVVFPVGLALAATSADVTITATPGFISITNAPGSYDFGGITANSTDNTTNGYFTITNGSAINIDIGIGCDNWTSAGSTWTYGTPAADTGRLMASSGDGGSGGSTGQGNFDIFVSNLTSVLLCDNVTDVTNPTWELQLQTPTSFTFGDEQQTTVTVTATAE